MVMGSNFVPVETILKIEDDETAERKMANDQHISSSLSSESPAFVSTGTQCSPATAEESDALNPLKDYSLIPYSGHDMGKMSHLVNAAASEQTNSREHPFSKHWPNIDPSGPLESAYQTSKFLLMSSPSSSQSYHDEEFFHQFDYKTRNTIKTKQRRSNPCYRDQERSRQRTVMRLKRQDPNFREAEREKGRFRMRIKRLNPEFRKQERQRQRERMKLKRQDPNFREKEREQQKNRLHEKRLDPEFREREKAQDRLRMQMKRHSSESFNSGEDSKKEKSPVVSQNSFYKNSTVNSAEVHVSSLISTEQTSSTTIVFDSITDVKPLLLKDKVPYESFQYRRGPVYNFHLYSNGKEQWLAPANSYSKGPPQFNVIRDDVHHQSGVGSSLNQNNVLYSTKERSESVEHNSNASTELNNKSEVSAGTLGTEKSHSSSLLFNDSCKTESNRLSLEPHPAGS